MTHDYLNITGKQRPYLRQLEGAAALIVCVIYLRVYERTVTDDTCQNEKLVVCGT